MIKNVQQWLLMEICLLAKGIKLKKGDKHPLCSVARIKLNLAV